LYLSGSIRSILIMVLTLFSANFEGYISALNVVYLFFLYLKYKPI
jgi:hypothetical protein